MESNKSIPQQAIEAVENEADSLLQNIDNDIKTIGTKKKPPLNTKHTDSEGNIVEFFVRRLYNKKQAPPGKRFLICRVKMEKINRQVEYHITMSTKILKESLGACKKMFWDKIKEQHNANIPNQNVD